MPELNDEQREIVDNFTESVKNVGAALNQMTLALAQAAEALASIDLSRLNVCKACGKSDGKHETDCMFKSTAWRQ